MNRKSYTLIGAAVGLAAFLAIALLPALLYGGYAGVLLGGGIVGTTVKATLLVRGLIVFGMVLGVGSVAALLAVGGAVAGSARLPRLEGLRPSPVRWAPASGSARRVLPDVALPSPARRARATPARHARAPCPSRPRSPSSPPWRWG